MAQPAVRPYGHTLVYDRHGVDTGHSQDGSHVDLAGLDGPAIESLSNYVQDKWVSLDGKDELRVG